MLCEIGRPFCNQVQYKAKTNYIFINTQKKKQSRLNDT